MRYAIVEKEKKSAFKGGVGICSMCESIVIAHCGDIRLHHWKHKSEDDCDTWSEGMTEWHIDWQNCFPIEMQEVTIVKNEEKHRADIFIENKQLVIEFQNSPISQQKIYDRELFYGNMIWVLNCNSHKEKIIITELPFHEWIKNIKIPAFYIKKIEDYNYYSNIETYDDILLKVYSDKIITLSNKVNDFYKSQSIPIKNQLYGNTLQSLFKNYNNGFYSKVDLVCKNFITDIFKELEDINTEFYKVEEELEYAPLLFKFEWSRMPRSWEVSSRPMYFDLGGEMYKIYKKSKKSNLFSVVKINKAKFVKNFTVGENKPSYFKLDKILSYSKDFLDHEISQSKELIFEDGKFDFS